MKNQFVKKLEFGFQSRVPVLLQVESSECGIACLAMIMGFHGHKVDLSAIRRRNSISIKGSSLKSIVEIAETLGLSTRAVRLDLMELPNLRLPCILHWGMNHFVVLVRVAGQKVIIHDPACGRRTVCLDVVSREFTGIALEAVPNAKFVRQDNRETIRVRDMFRHVSGIRSSLVILAALSIGLEVIALIMPMVSQVVIDEVVVTSDKDLLYTVIFGVAILLLLQMIISTVRQWAILLVSTKVSVQWNSSLFDHLSRLPLDFFSKRHVGDILSRFNALSLIQRTLTTDLVQTVMDGIMSVGMGIMLFVYGGWLGFIAVIATVLDILLRLFTYGSYRQAGEEQVVFEARQQSHFIETVRSMASVKLLGLRERRKSAWINHVVDSMNIRLKIQRYDLLYGRLSDLIFGSDRLVMMALGALAVMRGNLTVGMLVAFLSYKDQFASRIGNLISSFFKVRMLSVQTDRLSDIVMTSAESSEAYEEASPQNVELTGESASLSCDNLAVRYASQEPWIFRNISISVPSGKVAAIIGPSGCGKTTFLKALMGLIASTEGSIRLGDEDASQMSVECYRSKIAGVLQDDGLFTGSITDNISGFSDIVDVEWMTACAKVSVIFDDIMRMPMGFETLVGDMGAGLSGGQKQRIILARALYRRPRILFLDEATSHLDEATEARVACGLREMSITQVIVAHRPATIAHADLIYVFDNAGKMTSMLKDANGRFMSV